MSGRACPRRTRKAGRAEGVATSGSSNTLAIEEHDEIRWSGADCVGTPVRTGGINGCRELFQFVRLPRAFGPRNDNSPGFFLLDHRHRS